MYEQILFPIDEAADSTPAFDHVLDVAAAHGATVNLLYVADTTQPSVTRVRGSVVDTLEQEGERIVSDATARAETRGVSTVTDVIQGRPYSTIVSYAESREVDLIAMPTHGRSGLERFLLGSTTDRVIRRSDVPVLAIPWAEDEDEDEADASEIEYPYRTVLVATDGSRCAERALAAGIDVAKATDAALHLLSVVATPKHGINAPTDDEMEAREQRATDAIDAASATASEAGLDPTAAVEFGPSIHETIRSYIGDHDVDLAVVGTHGRTGFDRYVLGSVTEYLVRTSPIPVLTVRGSTEA